MTWLFLVLAVVIVAGIAALLTGVSAAGMSQPTASRAHQPLPPGALHDEDLDTLVLDRAVRGYRMDQVDAVIARLRAELAARDEQPPTV